MFWVFQVDFIIEGRPKVEFMKEEMKLITDGCIKCKNSQNDIFYMYYK